MFTRLMGISPRPVQLHRFLAVAGLLPLALGANACFRGDLSWSRSELVYSMSDLPSGAKVAVYGPDTVPVGQCFEFGAQLQDADGLSFQLTESVTVNFFVGSMSQNVEIDQFYDEDCTLGWNHSNDSGGDNGLSLPLVSGQSTYRLYFKFRGPGVLALGASVDGIGTSDLKIMNGTASLLDPMNVIETIAGPLSLRGYQESTGGSGTAARFSAPTGIVSSISGSTTTYTLTAYVADRDNAVIRKIVRSQVGGSANVVTSVVAGSVGHRGSTNGALLQSTFKDLSVLAVDPTGSALADSWTLIAADRCSLRSIDLYSGQVSTLAGAPEDCQDVDGTGTSARFTQINSIAVQNGQLLVSGSSGALRAVGLSINRGQVGTLNLVDSSTASPVYPRALVIQNGLVYAVNRNDNSIYSFGPVTGSSLSGSFICTNLNMSSSLYFEQFVAGPAGYLYGFSGGQLYKVDLASKYYLTVFAPTGFGSVDGISTYGGLGSRVGGLVYHPELDGVVFTDTENHLVRAVLNNAGTYSVATLVGMPGLVAYQTSGSIPGVTFGGIQSIAGGGDVFYITSAASNAIQKIDRTTGLLSEVAGWTLIYSGTSNKKHIALDGSGLLYAVHGAGSYAYFSRYDSGGARTDLYNSVSSTFTGLAIENTTEGVAASYAFVSNYNQNTILKISLPGGVVTQTYGIGGSYGSANGVATAATFYNPEGLALSPDNKTLYVLDTGNALIRAIDVESGVVSTFAGNGGYGGSEIGSALSVRMSWLRSITVDSQYVYVTDGNRIRRINRTSGLVDLVGPTDPQIDINGQIANGARLSDPMTLKADGAGGLYFSNAFNLRWIHP